MKKKRMISLLLVLAVLMLPACSKKPEPSGEPVAVDLARQTAEKYAAKVETDLSDYDLKVEFAGAQRENEPAFDGGGVSDLSDADTSNERFSAVLSKKGESSPVFDILISRRFYVAQLEETVELRGTPRARFGDKWLFSVHMPPDDNEAFYIYDASNGTLSDLGDYSYVMYFGDRIYLQPMVYAAEAQETAFLFDWGGSIITGFAGVNDSRLYNDTLYLICGFEPCALYGVSAGDLKDLAQPIADLICEFGLFNATFFEEDKIVLQQYAGGYPTTCFITDAAGMMRVLENGDVISREACVESNEYYSVSLSAWWNGKYVCEKNGDSMRFYHKAAKEAGEDAFILSLSIVDAPDDFERAGLGAYYDFAILCGISIPGNDGMRYIYTEFNSMLEGFGNEFIGEAGDMVSFSDLIGSNLSAEGDCELVDYDYNGWSTVYSGPSDAGDTVKLSIENVWHNYVSGRIWRGGDDFNWSFVDFTAAMYGNKGVLTWEIGGDEYNDYVSGGGMIEMTSSGVIKLKTTGEGDADTEATLSAVYVPESGERKFISGGLSYENDWFGVTVPDCWKGIVVCEKDDKSLKFYHKPSRDAGLNGFLFSLRIETETYYEDDWFASPVRKYVLDGAEYEILSSQPGDMQAALAYTEQYGALCEGITAVYNTIKAVKPGAQIEKFDFGFKSVNYVCSVPDGTYHLHLENEEKYSVTATVYFVPDAESALALYNFFFYYEEEETVFSYNLSDDGYDYIGGYGTVIFDGDNVNIYRSDDAPAALPRTMVFRPN